MCEEFFRLLKGVYVPLNLCSGFFEECPQDTVTLLLYQIWNLCDPSLNNLITNPFVGFIKLLV